MKSSFLEFCEKVERRYQNTCKKVNLVINSTSDTTFTMQDTMVYSGHNLYSAIAMGNPLQGLMGVKMPVDVQIVLI